MKQLWKEIKRSWQSFWLWISFLFADRWFDSSYLLRIIAHKCAYDAKMYELHGITIDADKVAKQLYEVADLCRKLATLEEYYEPYYIIHNVKWAPAHASSLYPRMEESIRQEGEELLAIGAEVDKIVQKDLARLGELFTHVLEWSD